MGTSRARSSEAADRLDITYNGGHPGLAEPHYHLRLSLLPHDAQTTALTP